MNARFDDAPSASLAGKRAGVRVRTGALICVGAFFLSLLAGCSIPCLAFIMRIYARRGDRAYVVICLLQIAVLLMAASGWLPAAH